VVEIDDLDSRQLVEAVLVWTGWGLEMMPNRDDSRVIRHFGDDAAARLLPIVKRLEDDFYQSDARLAADDLSQMAKLASDDFRRKHPGVSEQIVKALAWCYTFDFK
jgi:hypothetical protein